MDSFRFAWFLAPLLLLAFTLQLITIPHHALDDRELARAGKRLMAAGFLIAILRYTMIPYTPVTVLALVLISTGSMFSCLERVYEMVNRLRQRDIFGESQKALGGGLSADNRVA